MGKFEFITQLKINFYKTSNPMNNITRSRSLIMYSYFSGLKIVLDLTPIVMKESLLNSKIFYQSILKEKNTKGRRSLLWTGTLKKIASQNDVLWFWQLFHETWKFNNPIALQTNYPFETNNRELETKRTYNLKFY